MATNGTAYAPRWVSAHEVPAWTPDEILPGLFMGGTADEDTIDVPRNKHSSTATDGFDAVATLYAWARPAGWETEELRYGFYDSGLDPATAHNAIAAARWVHTRWSEGARVLVRCQAGLNRSGLITALVLMLAGHTAHDAIALIRERRSPWALCNDAFVRWLTEEAEHRLASAQVAA